MQNNAIRILFLGDVVGPLGRKAVRSYLATHRQKDGIDFVIANGENVTHGHGLSYEHYKELLDAHDTTVSVTVTTAVPMDDEPFDDIPEEDQFIPDDEPIPEPEPAVSEEPPVAETPVHEPETIPEPPAEPVATPEEPPDMTVQEDELSPELIRILEDLPPFAGPDRDYSLAKEDLVTLPRVLAEVLVNAGKAARITPTP